MIPVVSFVSPVSRSHSSMRPCHVRPARVFPSGLYATRAKFARPVASADPRGRAATDSATPTRGGRAQKQPAEQVELTCEAGRRRRRPRPPERGWFGSHRRSRAVPPAPYAGPRWPGRPSGGHWPPPPQACAGRPPARNRSIRRSEITVIANSTTIKHPPRIAIPFFAAPIASIAPGR